MDLITKLRHHIATGLLRNTVVAECDAAIEGYLSSLQHRKSSDKDKLAVLVSRIEEITDVLPT